MVVFNSLLKFKFTIANRKDVKNLKTTTADILNVFTEGFGIDEMDLEDFFLNDDALQQTEIDDDIYEIVDTIFFEEFESNTQVERNDLLESFVTQSLIKKCSKRLDIDLDEYDFNKAINKIIEKLYGVEFETEDVIAENGIIEECVKECAAKLSSLYPHIHFEIHYECEDSYSALHKTTTTYLGGEVNFNYEVSSVKDE